MVSANQPINIHIIARLTACGPAKCRRVPTNRQITSQTKSPSISLRLAVMSFVGGRVMPAVSQDAAQAVASLYAEPIVVSDFQSVLLDAATRSESGSPTPDKHQKMQSIMWNYLQANRDELGAQAVDSFSPMLAWICCGSSTGKFLSLAPKASLNELVEFANQAGMNVQVAV
jgi:hypothetical protein